MAAAEKRMTVVVQIGNSDDKLTQQQWAEFVSEVRAAVGAVARAIHFNGSSPPTSIWQNHCIIGEAASLDGLRDELARLAAKYHQESIALTVANTEFVKAKA